MLNIVGLVMTSASSVAALSDYGSSWYFFDRQLVWAIVGGLAFFGAATVDYQVWRRWAPWLLFTACAGLVLVLVPGIGIMVDGSRRWLGYGPVHVQPTEVAKTRAVVLRCQRARAAPIGSTSGVNGSRSCWCSAGSGCS